MQCSNEYTKVISLLQNTHPLTMAQGEAESKNKPINYGRFINQFLPDIITSIRQLDKINTNIYRQKMSSLFNQICLHEGILPKSVLRVQPHWRVVIQRNSPSVDDNINIYIYIYIYIYILYIYLLRWKLYIFNRIKSHQERMVHILSWWSKYNFSKRIG